MKRIKTILFYTFIATILITTQVKAETYNKVTKYLRSPYIINLTPENKTAIEAKDPNRIPVNPILGKLENGKYVYCEELVKNWKEDGTFNTENLSNNNLKLILANSFPYISLDELKTRLNKEVSSCSNANCNNLTYQEAITAIQGALWYYTDNNKVENIYNGYDTSHYPADYQIPSEFTTNSTTAENTPSGAQERINLLYNWLIKLENPSISVKITNSTITYDSKEDLYKITATYTVTVPNYLTLSHKITIKGDETTTITNPTVNNNTYTVTTTQKNPTADITINVSATTTDGTIVKYTSTDTEIQSMIGFEPKTTTISDSKNTKVSLLELTIKANNDCDDTLEGFTYTITGPNNIEKNCTTDKTGTCTIKGLNKGDYTLTQTAVPNDNYILNSEIKEFTITQTEVEAGTKTIEANPNLCNKTTLNLVIKVNNDCDEVVEGFVYGIINSKITDETNLKIGACTTDKTGTCTINNITEGTYILKQTAVPNEQYVLNSETKEFTITKTDIQKGTKIIEANPNVCEEIPESPQTGIKTIIIVISTIAIASLITFIIIYRKKIKSTK